MANKNTSSRAERMVSDTKKRTPPTDPKVKARKTPTKQPPPKMKEEYENPIPNDTVIAILSFFLFLLFLVVSINPEGALLIVVRDIVLGLFGQATFYFAIPGLFYLFFIHAFGRRKGVGMRRNCTLIFLVLCGIFYHLLVNQTEPQFHISYIGVLYEGGITGTTGGVICGGLAALMRWGCGTTFSFLVTGITAVFVFLGAMQITLPSILRAIANRPRQDWEDEEDEYVEPAARVVNHIANKKIEQKRQKRERAAVQRLPEPEEEEPEDEEELEPEHDESVAEEQPSEEKQQGKRLSFMNRIGGEIGAPLTEAAAAEEESPDIPQEEIPAQIPTKMPELNPVASEPKADMTEKTPGKPSAEKKSGKVSARDTAESAQIVAQEIARGQSERQTEYSFPPVSLLKRPVRSSADGTEEMRENSRRLNETLASFNIDAHIINVTRGPSVTRYEVELDKGVRLSKITGCADDIALSLGASGVRIAAVPGKISVVGIEVPNRTVTTVSLREVIDSQEFAKARSKSSISLGKSIDGNCVVGNIAKMPHLLIAGTTGSGKSVCMNSIIISLLYKAGPEDVKLIMVDPKMVELGIYNGIPHLLIPVVTDPKKAAGSLQWAVTEMLRRYRMMSDMGVRDLESYNSIITAEEDGQKLPQVVIIIDELADLMMVAAKEVEDSICRIAQMGRAAGMHLIIATQRPSANVITGLMKANIPSRIAFSVASAMESRIILDTMGAEKLVGKGDMLYAPIGCGKPLRVQGCFVTDGEVEAVAEYVKDNYSADYNQDVLDEIEKKAQQTGKKASSAADLAPSEEELEGDEMLPAAVDVILETGQASVSMLQRRLKLGYARAARIVDEMEEKGIVGPFQGSKPRAILLTKEQWEARKNGGQMSFDDAYDGVPEEI